jgi:hypothetical protein
MPPPHPGRQVEQLRPGERQEQDGQVVQTHGEELDQVEERRVRPVDVLEDERRRLVSRTRFDEDPDGLEEAVAIGGGCLRLEAEQDRDVPGYDLGFLLADEPLHEAAQLPDGDVDVVAVEDAGELFHLLREGAVRASLAIREAAAADDAPAARPDRVP